MSEARFLAIAVHVVQSILRDGKLPGDVDPLAVQLFIGLGCFAAFLLGLAIVINWRRARRRASPTES